jgi:hypothetical protein
MRKILTSAMLALTLAGGLMTFIAANVQATPQPGDGDKHCGDRFADIDAEPC